MNLVINLDRDEDWILEDNDRTLADYDIQNEYEISFFNRAEYEAYAKNPQVKWE